MEGKGERERYNQLNTELERTVKKEAFLNKQCNEIEENNRMGRIRDLFNGAAPSPASQPAEGSAARNGSGSPNQVFERTPQPTVASEKTTSRTAHALGSFRHASSVPSRKMSPYAPSPTSIAKKSEK